MRTADLDGTGAAGVVALMSSLVLMALVVFLAAAVCAARTIWPGLLPEVRLASQPGFAALRRRSRCTTLSAEP